MRRCTDQWGTWTEAGQEISNLVEPMVREVMDYADKHGISFRDAAQVIADVAGTEWVFRTVMKQCED